MFGEEDADKIIEQHREEVLKQEKTKVVYQTAGNELFFAVESILCVFNSVSENE